jgi:hypothetical protein
LAANGHGNKNMLPFHHSLKLAMETETRVRFQLTSQLSFVCLINLLSIYGACTIFVCI